MSTRILLRQLCNGDTVLFERSESFLSAVDLWSSSKGHNSAIAEKIGGGKMAVVVGLAAKSLLPDHPSQSLEQLQRASGLSPSAFSSALDALQPAIDVFFQSRRKKKPSRLLEDEPRLLSSPHKRQRLDDGASTSQPATPSSSSQRSASSANTPTSAMSLKEKAQAVQSGAAFGRAVPGRRSGASSSTSTPRTPGGRMDDRLGLRHGNTPTTSSSRIAHSPAATPTRRDSTLLDSRTMSRDEVLLRTPSRSGGKSALARTPSSLRKTSQFDEAMRSPSNPMSGSAASTPKSVRFNHVDQEHSQTRVEAMRDAAQAVLRALPSSPRKSTTELDLPPTPGSSSLSPLKRSESAVKLKDAVNGRRRSSAARKVKASSILRRNEELPLILFPLSSSCLSLLSASEMDGDDQKDRRRTEEWIRKSSAQDLRREVEELKRRLITNESE